MLDNYFQDIFNTTKIGDATEESYYPDLKKFLDTWSTQNNKNFHITALPKRTEAGNPDFRVLTSDKELVGYIEAKAPTVENLDHIEDTEQLKRYRSTFPNLILTNFFEFRLYRNGQLIDKISIGRPFIIHQLKTVPPVENQDKFTKLLEQFFSFSIPVTTTAKSLAIELAKRTRFLRDNVIAEELKEENIEGVQTLESFFMAFEEHLIPSLSKQDFANLFAQTITYGLFAARSRAKEDFNRKLAYEYIPPTIGILKKVFQFISSSDLPISMEWIIDDIAEVLARSDVQKIIANFYQEGKGRDPIIHFYETFLAEYDPKERERRGVYYTPEPVVSYITRSIHKLLKEKFGKEDGFATQSVTVLDPAAGTLTFPAFAINLAISEYKEKFGEGGIKSLIKDHILKDFYAFELMMASYAIGHLKMGLILDHFNYQLTDEERFHLFLTNTLDFSKEDPNKFPGIFEQTIAKESQEALKVKEDIPVMVVMGNPPYSVSSTNVIKEGSDYHKLYESYKEIVRKEERNIQPLSDDYIKFIAFAHWKIKQAGQGIIGMITNNSYLDGLIHRDIRRKLSEDFNEIYILNLHGNTKRQENTLDGGKDENVFDIQQGVSIILLIKKDGLRKQTLCYDLQGLRETKYEFLDNNDVESTKWQKLEPREHNYFFVPKDITGKEDYDNFVSVKEIFEEYNAGIATGKDDALTDFDKSALIQKMSVYDDQVFKTVMSQKNIDESLINKWVGELKNKEVADQIKEYNYRPFDKRWVIYNPNILQRARKNLMDNFLKQNIGLCVTKQLSTKVFYHALVTDSLTDRCFVSLNTREVTYIFPLFIYGENNNQTNLFESKSNISRQNFTKEFIEFIYKDDLSQILPEDIFCYIYAILFSNTYRKKYQEFLKIDFPKIPFTKKLTLFQRLADLGKQLVDLHLLKTAELDNPATKFYGQGNNTVGISKFVDSDEVAEFHDILIATNWSQSKEKPDFKSKGIVVINDEKQFFGSVSKEVWNYYIGGYQVLNKWLKGRKGRVLSSEDIKHYCKIVTALSKTIEIQKEINRLYPKVEKSLIES